MFNQNQNYLFINILSVVVMVDQVMIGQQQIAHTGDITTVNANFVDLFFIENSAKSTMG